MYCNSSFFIFFTLENETYKFHLLQELPMQVSKLKTDQILFLSNILKKILLVFWSFGEKLSQPFKLSLDILSERHQRCSINKVVLKNFAKFTKLLQFTKYQNFTKIHLCQSLFFNKVAGWGEFSKRIYQ